MGLDVTAKIVVGAPSKEILEKKTIKIEVIKTDKYGTKYTVEEEQEIYIFMGKIHKNIDDEFPYYLLEINGLEEFNEEIIGIEIEKTASHRLSHEPIIIDFESFNNKINLAIKKMNDWGIKSKIYLVQDISY